MKIFSSDGSYTTTDNNFGWILESHRSENNQEINFSTPPTKPFHLKTHNPGIVSQEEIAKLITPVTVESKILLSMVWQSLYKIKKQVIEAEDVKTIKKINFLLRGTHIGKHLEKETERYMKEHHKMSIMMEVVTQEMKYDIGHTGTGTVPKIDDHEGKHLTCDLNLLKCYKQLGCTKVLQQICNNYCNLHKMFSIILKLQTEFQVEESRLQYIIEDSHSLQKNLRETIFLDNLIHLLIGDLEYIFVENAPFKVFLRGFSVVDCNLII